MGTPEVVPGHARAAIVGGGFIGPVHAEALRRIGVRVVGLLGSSPERARATAQLWFQRKSGFMIGVSARTTGWSA